MLLGNDIVDRKKPGAENKHLDNRFIGRVFTNEEAACIRTAFDPSLSLWMIWAVKESVFKVMRKLDPELVFSHREFALNEECLQKIGTAASAQGKIATRMTHKEQEFAILLSWNENFVHGLAGWSRRGILNSSELAALTSIRVETLRERDCDLSARELDSVHSDESRQVRLLAKEMLCEHHQMHDAELVRERKNSRFLPPELQENGRRLPSIDLSLSHDGQFVAAVITADERKKSAPVAKVTTEMPFEI